MNGLSTTLIQHRVTARSDSGEATLLLMATDVEAAIASFMEVEQCPRRAITKVEFYDRGAWWPANILTGDHWAHEDKAKRLAEFLVKGNHRTAVREAIKLDDNPAWLALSVARHLAFLRHGEQIGPVISAAAGAAYVDAVVDVQSLVMYPN